MAQQPNPYDTSQLAVKSYDYVPFPSSGAKSLALTLTFQTATAYKVDLSQLAQSGNGLDVQSAFIDNSLSTAILYITMDRTGQTVAVPPLMQGFVSLIAATPTILTFQSTGGIQISAWLLNTPQTNAFWSPSGAASFSFIAGKLSVTDTVLESIVNSGSASVTPRRTASGNILIPDMIGNYSALGSITPTSSGNSSGVLCTGAPGYYVASIQVQPSSDCTTASGRGVLLQAVDSSSGAIWQHEILPAESSSGGTAGFNIPVGTEENWEWTSKITASTLALTLASALGNGHLYYTVSYAISNFLA